MRFKFIPILALTIAGTAMILAACQSPTPSTQATPASQDQAQNTENSNTSTPPDSGSKGSMRGALPQELNLTDEQKTKLKGIQENYRSKIENILTDEQKNELKAAQGQGTGRKAMPSLNLTDAQKQQLKDVRQSQRQEIDNVLTAEQKQQLQKMRQSWQKKSKSEDSSASQSQ